MELPGAALEGDRSGLELHGMVIEVVRSLGRTLRCTVIVQIDVQSHPFGKFVSVKLVYCLFESRSDNIE